jgi:hypothetical protein
VQEWARQQLHEEAEDLVEDALRRAAREGIDRAQEELEGRIEESRR